MTELTRESLLDLAGVEQERCVSLFLPLHRAGSGNRPAGTEEVVQWKNLLRDVEERLRAASLPAREIDARLDPARALLEDVEFWRQRADGLAAFAAPGAFRTFHVPLHLAEMAVVGPRFHVAPLLPLVAGEDRFYILALSQNDVRLIDAHGETAQEVTLAGVPASLEEALQYDEPQQSLQFHSAGSHAAGRRPAMFHGQGGGADERAKDVQRFVHAVDRGLVKLLRGDGVPLVLAAVESLAAAYRHESAYPHLLPPVVAGNPEGLSPRALQERALPLVRPHLRQARDAASARFLELRGTAKATSDLIAVLGAAMDGRVDALFVPAGVQRWGRFDGVSRDAELGDTPRDGDEDLLNAAAVYTLRAGGAVYAVDPEEIPGGGEVAAVLRY